MALALIPLYIKLMGVESYAIVGVFTSLMAVVAVLDLGLSQAMNREMARLSSDTSNARRLGDTARTLEVVYWGVAIVVGVVISLLSEPIANYWLNPEQLARDDLRQALQIMGLVIGLRWPVSLYVGGLNGLQQQVQANVWLSIVATIQGVGALGVLWLVAPTIQAFFVWQAIIALAQVFFLRAALWRSLPLGTTGSFERGILKEVWRFAAGMSGISLLATILTQLDKIILSRILNLSEFGYYIFASTVAGGLFRLSIPVFTAYYPRLTELVARNDRQGLVSSYHKGSQLLAVAILPVAFLLIFFSKEILQMWSQDPELVKHTWLLTTLLVIGNLLNGIMHMPYALQLAYGWTSLAFYQNIIAVVLLVPAMFLSASRWGATGVACIWIALNVGYLIIGVHVMHRRLLCDQKWNWYIQDVILPALGVISVTFIGSVILNGSVDLHFVIFGPVIAIVSLSFAVVIASQIRIQFLASIEKHYKYFLFKK